MSEGTFKLDVGEGKVSFKDVDELQIVHEDMVSFHKVAFVEDK